MEFAIAKSVLSDELSKLQSVIAKKTAIPILSSILIESTSDQGIRISATNMESTIYSHIPPALLVTTQAGRMCVPATRIIDIVRLASDGPMKISSDDNSWVRVASGRTNFRIPGMNPEQFPPLPDYSNLEWITVPATFLRAMIPGVKYAITKEEGRLNLRGAKVEINKGAGEVKSDLKLITTDGHRISLASSFLDEKPAKSLEVMIPVGGVDELIKLIGDQTGQVGISMSSAGLFFWAGQRILCTQLLTAKFPGYSMPFQALGTYQTFCTYRAEVLAQAVKRALLCSGTQSDGKKAGSAICFNFESTELGMNSLRISAADADLGEANETLDSDFNGGDLRIYINGRFLLDYLEPVGNGNVRFEIKDGKSQMYLISEKDSITFYGCIMPMRDPEAN